MLYFILHPKKAIKKWIFSIIYEYENTMPDKMQKILSLDKKPTDIDIVREILKR